MSDDVQSAIAYGFGALTVPFVMLLLARALRVASGFLRSWMGRAPSEKGRVIDVTVQARGRRLRGCLLWLLLIALVYYVLITVVGGLISLRFTSNSGPIDLLFLAGFVFLPALPMMLLRWRRRRRIGLPRSLRRSFGSRLGGVVIPILTAATTLLVVFATYLGVAMMIFPRDLELAEQSGLDATALNREVAMAFGWLYFILALCAFATVPLLVRVTRAISTDVPHISDAFWPPTLSGQLWV